MDTVIATTIISAGASLIGTFAGIIASTKLMLYRIEQLEKKVDRFADIEQKFYDLEGHNRVQDEKITHMEAEQERIIDDIKLVKGRCFISGH